MIEINYEGQNYEFEEDISLKEIGEILVPGNNFVGAVFNNVVKNLNYVTEKGGDISFFDGRCKDGHSILTRTITFVFLLAVKKILPEKKVNVEHSMGAGIYLEFDDGEAMKWDLIKEIKKEMKNIIEADIPLIRRTVDMTIAKVLFKAEGYDDKLRLFDTLDFDTVDVYEVEDHIFTFHGYLAPSTSYVSKFDVVSYYPGAIVIIPTRQEPDMLPEFKEEKSLAKIFAGSKKWTDLLKIGDVAALNERIIRDDIDFLIKVNEAYIENQIAEMAQDITEDPTVNVVLIAGPSSSGKTTLSYRLSVQLGVRGMAPVPIHMDDYFVDRVNTPRDETGNRNYEMLEAVDLKKFNEDLLRLIQGEEVELPEFDFVDGVSRPSGRRIQLDDNSIIIIEGIHGLNPGLTSLIPEKNKYKIYVSALTNLNIDSHNRISTTDMRLLRRMVRDFHTRGKSVDETFDDWPKVRRGEKEYIFPYQDFADRAIDSSLVYEISVLKKHIYDLLKNYPEDGRHYKNVKRFLSFLKYFRDIENDAVVPNNSILREFIGDR
ncbi:MAG: nucleoside kinase [Tissierellia bacterium]|nr:nucleoside kinase [Tissierellia bacterium]